MIEDLRHLGTNRDLGKSGESLNLFAPHWSEPAFGTPAHLMVNSHYSVHISPPPLRGTPWQVVVLPKTQASSRIPLMIGISIAGAICLKALGKMQAGIKLKSERWRAEYFTLLKA